MKGILARETNASRGGGGGGAGKDTAVSLSLGARLHYYLSLSPRSPLRSPLYSKSPTPASPTFLDSLLYTGLSPRHQALSLPLPPLLTPLTFTTQLYHPPTLSPLLQARGVGTRGGGRCREMLCRRVLSSGAHSAGVGGGVREVGWERGEGGGGGAGVLEGERVRDGGLSPVGDSLEMMVYCNWSSGRRKNK